MNVEFISLARHDFLNVFTPASHSCKYKKNLVSLVKYIQYSTILYKYTVKIEYIDLHLCITGGAKVMEYTILPGTFRQSSDVF